MLDVLKTRLRDTARETPPVSKIMYRGSSEDTQKTDEQVKRRVQRLRHPNTDVLHREGRLVCGIRELGISLFAFQGQSFFFTQPRSALNRRISRIGALTKRRRIALALYIYSSLVEYANRAEITL